MSNSILDASALLALLNQEQGEQPVANAVAGETSMSAVNLSEVVAKLADLAMSEDEIRETLEPLGLEIVDFGADDAYGAGLLRPATRTAGLSFGDRVCLALGARTGAPVLTANQSWASLDIDVDVQISLIR